MPNLTGTENWQTIPGFETRLTGACEALRLVVPELLDIHHRHWLEKKQNTNS